MGQVEDRCRVGCDSQGRKDRGQDKEGRIWCSLYRMWRGRIIFEFNSKMGSQNRLVSVRSR